MHYKSNIRLVTNMGFKGLTLNRPAEEPAGIYAEHDAAIFQSIFGNADAILNYGLNFRIDIASATSIRVNSGIVSVQGRIGVIECNDSQVLSVANGKSGITRKDLLVARFVSTGMHGIDTMELIVLTGNSNGSGPAYTTENLNNGGKIREFPIGRITMNGLSISKAEIIQPITPSALGSVPSADEIKVAAGISIEEALSQMGAAIQKMEVQKIVVENMTVPKSAYVEDHSTAFQYRATIKEASITSKMLAAIAYSDEDIVKGIVSPYIRTYNGGIYLYAYAVPDADVKVDTFAIWPGGGM